MTAKTGIGRRSRHSSGTVSPITSAATVGTPGPEPSTAFARAGIPNITWRTGNPQCLTRGWAWSAWFTRTNQDNSRTIMRCSESPSRVSGSPTRSAVGGEVTAYTSMVRAE
ncbi:hypothetical protein ACIP8U_43435 [Streptomyces pseudovenezuelae]|uniref:hypothetical protein n=1 Tax=Streptomyces pseudovenezuelae TaxID=67350 RepID=UPI003821E7BE